MERETWHRLQGLRLAEAAGPWHSPGGGAAGQQGRLDEEGWGVGGLGALCAAGHVQEPWNVTWRRGRARVRTGVGVGGAVGAAMGRHGGWGAAGDSVPCPYTPVLRAARAGLLLFTLLLGRMSRGSFCCM